MDNATEANDGGHLSSPWPPLVAVGFAVSEVGVLFGTIPIVVGGILLFGGSCAGILHETDYVQTMGTPLRVIGVLFVLAGGILWGSAVPVLTVDAALQAVEYDRVALRGAAILIGGALLVLGGLVGIDRGSRIAS